MKMALFHCLNNETQISYVASMTQLLFLSLSYYVIFTSYAPDIPNYLLFLCRACSLLPPCHLCMVIYFSPCFN